MDNIIHDYFHNHHDYHQHEKNHHQHDHNKHEKHHHQHDDDNDYHKHENHHHHHEYHEHDNHHQKHHHNDHHEKNPMLSMITSKVEEEESMIKLQENFYKIIAQQQMNSTVDYRKLIHCPSNPSGRRLRNPYDCNRFYLCYKQGDQVRLALYNCPHGTFFDDTPTVQNCILRSDYEERYGQCKTLPLPHDDDDNNNSLAEIMKKIVKKIKDYLDRKYREYEEHHHHQDG
ncbi:uncharacterized protein LOC142597523 [Dermatophagoides farinae]|uniref:uncharacterized protein LOC142597523 n=1 Tax=Dermatophagoides farinae TaxID=6954 RepID=UPI003F5DDE9F